MPPARPSRPIETLEPPGWGPWNVFLLVNVGEGEDSKKQTEIRLGKPSHCKCAYLTYQSRHGPSIDQKD